MADSDSFNFLKETFFGNLLCETWESSGRDANELLNSFPIVVKSNSHEILKREAHERQIIYGVIPEQIRKSISLGNYDDVIRKFRILITGDGKAASPRPDIALELSEWIFSGFDEDRLMLTILELITENKIAFPEDFIERLKTAYSSSTQVMHD